MKSKTAALLIIALVSLISGAATQFSRATDLPIGLFGSAASDFLIYCWYYFDASERHYRCTSWLNIGVAAFAVAALPYYFFRSRGARDGLFATAWFAIGTLAWVVLFITGAIVTHAALHVASS